MVCAGAAREGGATGDMTASSMTATAVSSTWGTNTNQSAEVDDLDSQLSSGMLRVNFTPTRYIILFNMQYIICFIL